MTIPAVRVHDLWKRYRIGDAAAHAGTLYETLARGFAAPWRWVRGAAAPRREPEPFWALREIEMEVQPGEVVGIIGRNGAGKSTLLKILSRITPPTRGRVEIAGRVASLLEVGTGFHPELTGRENLFLNGAILGMSRREIERKFDEIVAFAEIEKFLDTPVKRYSSGMYVRLAFAVAAHLEPDVLIVDEVLAVGDSDFQRKCLAKMEDVGKLGRTILFVSHNLAAVRRLCDRSLLLDKGRGVAFGPTRQVIDTYLATGGEQEVRWDTTSAPASERVRLDAVRVIAAGAASPTTDDALRVEVEVTLLEAGQESLAVVLHLHDSTGNEVLSTMSTQGASTTPMPWYGRSHLPGPYRLACEIPGGLLNDLTYTISVYLTRFAPFCVETYARHAISVDLSDSRTMREPGITAPWQGIVRTRLAWSYEPLRPAATPAGQVAVER